MFMFLNQLPIEQQEKFLENLNNMRKKGIEEIERKKREAEKEARIIKFIRENPPVTIKDMYIYGNLITKYGDKIFLKKECVKTKKVETNDVSTSTDDLEESTASKSWFGF